ncbi:hypothetical protein CF8_0908 [Nocardioides sp. CF8]|uniref:AAA family ATPase n=1 Tax=Nocardioides sp. CF8 TaxID=110319 RepID=UPI00033137CB|nr:AAA family ATPase [Nocardioides sp. CF8]EON25009.1 hypothetical protein CF8_0908 [Nocardioides sp. CF8]
MIEDPYTPGSASPAYLSGRGHELAVIDELAARVRSLGRSGGPLLAFYGPRGTGKTSLLRHAQAEAHRAGMFTAWVTGRGDASMVDALAKSLNRAVGTASLGEKANGLLHRIDQVQVEFGLPGAKVGAQFASKTKAADVVHDLLEDTARFARNHKHHGLLLFVDEFHEASVEDRKSLLIALQEFDGDSISPTPVGIVAAGLPSIHAAITEAATFGERTRFIEVKGLTPAAAAEALRLPAERLGVDWDDHAIAAAVELAHTYPYKVQIVGSCTWNFARPAANSVITEGHVRGATDDIEDRMDELYRTRWAAASPAHRRILQAIAAGGGDTATRDQIAARVGKSTNDLSRPRDELIERGLIAPSGRGQVTYTIPGFGAYIRRRIATELDDSPTAGRAQPLVSPPANSVSATLQAGALRPGNPSPPTHQSDDQGDQPNRPAPPAP